jgi:hypothetical protein
LQGCWAQWACMLTRVDRVADQAAIAGQADTAAVGGSLLAVLPELLQARALATPLVIPSVASSAAKAKRLVPRMTWRHPSPERRAFTGPSCCLRERRSFLHLHGADSLAGPRIFHSATGSCSSLPWPDSVLADVRASLFRATPFSSTMTSTALPEDSFSTHFSSVDFPRLLSAARHSCHSTARCLITSLTIPRQKRDQRSLPMPPD